MFIRTLTPGLLEDLVYFYRNQFDQLAYSQTKNDFPPMSICYEENNKFVEIKMSVAGFEKENISIFTEDEYLIIQGKMKEEAKKEKVVYLKNNLKCKEINRAFEFKDNFFDFRNPEVLLENGILTLKINKNPLLVSEKKEIKLN